MHDVKLSQFMLYQTNNLLSALLITNFNPSAVLLSHPFISIYSFKQNSHILRQFFVIMTFNFSQNFIFVMFLHLSVEANSYNSTDRLDTKFAILAYMDICDLNDSINICNLDKNHVCSRSPIGAEYRCYCPSTGYYSPNSEFDCVFSFGGGPCVPNSDRIKDKCDTEKFLDCDEQSRRCR